MVLCCAQPLTSFDYKYFKKKLGALAYLFKEDTKNKLRIK
jgi:hypothetical protein